MLDFLSQFVPNWVSIAFLLAIPIPIFMIAKLAQKGFGKGKTIYFSILLFYFSYLIYVSIACFNGWFEEISLPPQILKITMIPLLLFLVLLIFNLPIYKRILKNLSLSDLVQIHIFRLIGSFFIILWLFDALPKTMALIAGIGDITTALSSLWLAKIIREKKNYSKKAAWLWNSFGLLDIIATSSLAMYFTKITLETGIPQIEALASFPFCFIPAFAPATIIFLHLSVYRKLLMKG